MWPHSCPASGWLRISVCRGCRVHQSAGSLAPKIGVQLALQKCARQVPSRWCYIGVDFVSLVAGILEGSQALDGRNLEVATVAAPTCRQKLPVAVSVATAQPKEFEARPFHCRSRLLQTIQGSKA